MPVSAHMESSHRLRNHGSSSLEHHSSGCVIDCLSSSANLSFGNRHCHSTTISHSLLNSDFKYPSLNNNQICSKIASPVDHSPNSLLHVITTSSGNGPSSAPYNDSSVISSSISTTHTPNTIYENKNGLPIDQEACEEVSFTVVMQQSTSPSPTNQVAPPKQPTGDSLSAEDSRTTDGPDDDKQHQSITVSESSDSTIENENQPKYSANTMSSEKPQNFDQGNNNSDYFISEPNYDDSDASHHSSKMTNSFSCESHFSPKNPDASPLKSLDSTIESVLDKIRTGRGEEVEFDMNSRSQDWLSAPSNDSSQSLSNSGSQQMHTSPSIVPCTMPASCISQFNQGIQFSPKATGCDSNKNFANKLNTISRPSNDSDLNPPHAPPIATARNMSGVPYPTLPRHSQLSNNASRMPVNMFHSNSMYPHQNVLHPGHPNAMPNYNMHHPNSAYTRGPPGNFNFNNSNYYGYNGSSTPKSFYPNRGYDRMLRTPTDVSHHYSSKQPISLQTFQNAPPLDPYQASFNGNPMMYQYGQVRSVHPVQSYDPSMMNPPMFQQRCYLPNMESNSTKNLSQSMPKSLPHKRNHSGDKSKFTPQTKKRRHDDSLEFNYQYLESVHQQLARPDFQKNIQEPLVKPPLFLAAPKGGRYSSKDDIDEVEESSELILEKTKKYELTPFALKFCRSNYPPKEDSFVVQSLKNCGNILKLPTKPIFTKPILICRSSTPDPCVCPSPNSNDNFESNFSIPSLNALEVESIDNRPSRVATPAIPFYQHAEHQSAYLDCSVQENQISANGGDMDLTISFGSNSSEIKSGNHDSNPNSVSRNGNFTFPASFRPVNGYAEQPTSIAELLKHQQMEKCEICNSPVVDWQYVQRTDDSNSDLNGVKKLFCSVTCLTSHVKKCLPSVNEPNESDYSSQFVQDLYINSTNISSRILIKGPLPKVLKKPAKRSLERRTAFLPSVNSKEINKKWKEVRYKRFKKNFFPMKSDKSCSKPDDILNASPSLKADDCIKDTRVCRLCLRIGDSLECSAGRLINHDIDDWFHVNCALWCYEVYETISGALVDPNETSYIRAANTKCHYCGEYGAGLPCYRSRCNCIYHVPCAQEAGCMFFTDRGMYCPMHKLASDHPMHMSDISANRKIYLDRDTCIVVGNAILNSQHSKSCVIRSGTLILSCIGQLTDEQMLSGNFNDITCIYPVGYKVYRIFWSAYEVNKRCVYECSIIDKNQAPFFIVKLMKNDEIIEENEASSCDSAWKPFLEKISIMRDNAKLIRLYPHLLKGKDLFGFNDSHVIRACESLPRVEVIPNYIFRYGRLQNLNEHEPPKYFCLSGAARLENRYTVELCHRSSRWARSRFAAPTVVNVLQSSSNGRQNSINPNLDYGAPQSKFNKLQLFKRLTSGNEWKFNVYFGPSKSHGMGLFAARNMEKQTMIIEFVGELVRNQVADQREKLYKSRHQRNVILMRLRNGLVLDATNCGNLSRFIRHSCNPNCFAELLIIDGKFHVVLSAGRTISVTEELTFDFKVDQYAAENSWQLLEPYQGPPKVPCFCGASTCKKWIS